MSRIAPLTDAREARRESAEPGDASDLALVQRCARKDTAALREIVRRYGPKLTRFLHPMLDSREDTEEAVQDVFLRAWQQADRFEGRAAVATWLYRIAANAAYDLLRRRKTQCRTLPLDDAAPLVGAGDAEQEALEGLARDEMAGRLRQALHALRPEDRLLLVLYYGEEMEYAQIGEITRCPYPVLKVRLMRARQRLRAAMDARAPEVTE